MAHTKPALDPWHIARLILDDAKPEVSPSVFNQISGTLRSRDWRRLLKVLSDFNPQDFVSVEEYTLVSQITAIFKKNADFTDPTFCRSAAQANFARAEKICKITNKRLDHYEARPERLDPQIAGWLDHMRKTIAHICGNALDWLERIPELVYVTSGATSTSPRAKSLPFQKIRKRVPCTAGAAPYVKAACRFFYDAEPNLTLTAHNRVTTVPKTSLTDRTIACEPAGNLPFQLSIDRFLKERLKAFYGIDLSDQTQNQRLARQGSVDGSLATIDLSMASDTLAFNTVMVLFPEDWIRHLIALRCTSYKGCFGVGTYHKFSSMGNGFTFTLETIVFLAACIALGSKVRSVYGDDIVLDAHLAPDLLRLLRFLGFVPNTDKTFITGPFRESCGRDYFGGIDVRPFFYRKTPTNPAELCHTINGLVTVGRPGGLLWYHLRDVVFSRRLWLVPENSSSTSGIHIDSATARKFGYLRTRNSVDVFRGYLSKARTRISYGIRTYLLWHFKAYTADVSPLQCREVVTSEVPVLTQTLREGRMVWNPPDHRQPHLYWWSDIITRILG